jgi:quercetin dioxygenase-like cupin family protein
MKTTLALSLGAITVLALLGYVAAGGMHDGADQTFAPGEDRLRATVVGPEGTEVRWLMPASEDDLGNGIQARLMVDYTTVPHASLGAFVITSGATGILVHAHVMQAEVIYVISGHGVALVGEDGQEEVRVEPGSVLYVPEGAWHGFRNDDPEDRLKILIITRPTHEGGLADFFRNAGTPPGEATLGLSYGEFIARLTQYGMEVPQPRGDG